MNLDTAARRYIAFFEGFTPHDLERFGEIFAADARFKDPFNDVQGIAAIRTVFAHMYKPCPQARFEVHGFALDDTTAFLHWHFHCKKDFSIDGLSKVRFSADGRVVEHIDYWDPAEQIYSHIPVIGGFFRWLKRRLAA